MEGDASETLKWFKHFGGIIVSIRCLDEGVDIPAVSHALILASSQNPREFIQRRGRVLRISPEKPEKKIAVIHDAIVVPSSVSGTYDQVPITKVEIQRALEFAGNALNRNAEIEILNIAVDLGIDLDDISNLGFEDDSNG
jgi:superfamily II DNA or RNA helicase